MVTRLMPNLLSGNQCLLHVKVTSGNWMMSRIILILATLVQCPLHCMAHSFLSASAWANLYIFTFIKLHTQFQENNIAYTFPGIQYETFMSSFTGWYHNFLRVFMHDLALIVFLLSLKSAYFSLIFFIWHCCRPLCVFYGQPPIVISKIFPQLSAAPRGYTWQQLNKNLDYGVTNF